MPLVAGIRKGPESFIQPDYLYNTGFSNTEYKRAT